MTGRPRKRQQVVYRYADGREELCTVVRRHPNGFLNLRTPDGRYLAHRFAWEQSRGRGRMRAGWLPPEREAES